MPRFAQPSFPLSRAGFVRPGEVGAEPDAGVSAWLARIAGSRAAGGASDAAAAGAGFAMAPAGVGFVPAA